MTIKTLQPPFVKVGRKTRMSPAALMLTAAQLAFGESNDVTRVDALRGKAFVRELLAAARDGGYLQCEVLETVLVQRLSSRRSIEMAQAACACITPIALKGVYARVARSIGEAE